MKLVFFGALMLLFLPISTVEAVTFVDLGTAAPTSIVGDCSVQAFDQTPQYAIPNYTNVYVINGNPLGTGDLAASTSLSKRSIGSGSGWTSWSNGYSGAVYSYTGNIFTLTLPANTGAFYLYIQPSSGIATFTVSTDSGVSGYATVLSSTGANGFGFCGDLGETIAYVTIAIPSPPGTFAIGEFGIGNIRVPAPTAQAIPTLSEWTQLLLALMTIMLVGWHFHRERSY